MGRRGEGKNRAPNKEPAKKKKTTPLSSPFLLVAISLSIAIGYTSYPIIVGARSSVCATE